MGTLVNALSIVIGGLLGLFLRKGFPERFTNIIMKGISLCILAIGIQGVMHLSNPMLLILCIVSGSLIGELLQIEYNITRFVNHLLYRFKQGDHPSRITDGFVSSMMIFCVGAMAIMGSIESGITGDNNLLYTKSLLDGITAIILATSQGVGVVFSAIGVFVYQGSLTLGASFLAPYLNSNVIEQISTVGSILLIGLSLNILEITHLKIMNYVPAMFMPILLVPLFEWLKYMY